MEDAIELIDLLYSTAIEYKVEITVSVDPGHWYELARYFRSEPRSRERGAPHFQHGPIRVEPQVGIKHWNDTPIRSQRWIR